MAKTANWRIFIICIGVAVFAWLINALGKNYTSVINYPIKVEYRLPAKSRKRVKNTPNKIKIQVEGLGWDLLKFKFRKTSPMKIVVWTYHRRPYITKYEIMKIFRKSENTFKVKKILIDDAIRVYA